MGFKRGWEGQKVINVTGFQSGERTFGEVKCFQAVINDKVGGAVMLINGTLHVNSIVELISPANLWEKLGLEDGGIVTVKVKLRS